MNSDSIKLDGFSSGYGFELNNSIPSSGIVFQVQAPSGNPLFGSSPPDLGSFLDKEITSLDDIIDPYNYASQYLSDQSVEGKARYLHYLEQAKYIQQMQMAKYNNWYNSPEQQAKRMREAGLNPDLLGVDGAPAEGASAPESSGVAGVMPTDLAESQLRSQRINNIMNVVSGVASVAGLVSQFANLSLLPAQKTSLENANVSQSLDNIAKEKALLTSGVAGRLASLLTGTESDEAFDYDGFFGSDLSGVFNAYTSGHPNSSAIWSEVLSNRESIKNEALSLAKSRAENQTGFAKIAGSRFYSDDVVLQSAMVGPLMDAQIELEQNRIRYEQKIMDIKSKYAGKLDIEGLASTANRVAGAEGAEADYQNEYFSALDAEQMAAYEFMIKSNESVKASMEKAINDNLKTIYNMNKYSERGFAAAYLFSGGAAKDWRHFLVSYELVSGIERFDPNNPQTFVDSSSYSKLTGSSPNPNPSYRAFIPLGSVAIQ